MPITIRNASAVLSALVRKNSSSGSLSIYKNGEAYGTY